MTKSANEIWDAALGGLELQVTKANYQTWLRDTIGLSYDNGCIMVLYLLGILCFHNEYGYIM